ncbi:MAG: 30S ribosome-binding factor RbfA [Betaproteobacteria bacterium]|nr:30S ribosome-binding factor RbfA [Betaproteobacteria bacterium]
MARGSRGRRQGQEIQRLLPDLLRLELKDPRVTGMITVTAVEVSHDLSQAKVFVTVLGSPDTELTLEGLNRGSAFLRSGLAQRLRSRTVPALHFVYDASVERGVELTRLIESAVRDDRDASKPDQDEK